MWLDRSLSVTRHWPCCCRRASAAATSAASTVSTFHFDEPSSSSSLSYDRDTGIIWEASSQALSRRRRPLYQTIIGIEIHAQLAIPTKLFSSAPSTTRGSNNLASSSSNASSNTLVHPIDLAYPGTLPALSQRAVHASILSAAALNCTIHKSSRFERKHYFYPDLPQGYQITQQRWPLASGGLVTFMPHAAISDDSGKVGGGKKQKKRRRGKSSRDDANDEEGTTVSNSNAKNSDFKPQPIQMRIDRIQLEQDTGKTTTHTEVGTNVTKSYIDYNRAGCALIEIVSHPDLRSAHEAAGVVEHIRQLLRHVGSCDGRMEEGSLRCDLNVSIAPIYSNRSDSDDDDDGMSSFNYLTRDSILPPGNGHRVEVKNLNSIRQIIAATEYEAIRQVELTQLGTPTGRETRTFHVKPISNTYPLGGETYCIRAKGDAIDYRFMPEPDLPPLILDSDTMDCESIEEYIQQYMPELPDEVIPRLVNDYGLSEDVARVITSDPPAIALFEQTVDTARSELLSLEQVGDEDLDDKFRMLPTLAANWMCNDLFALVKKSAVKGDSGEAESGEMQQEDGTLNHPISVEYSTVDGKRLGALVALVFSGKLTTSMAKKVLTIMYEDEPSSHPKDIAKANKWEVISDMETLIQLCEGVAFDPKNASQLEQYQLGGKKVWKIEKFFVGRVMAASRGNAHPELLKEALAKVLEGLK